LNTHYNRGRKGLGFANKRVVYPPNRKYVDLRENIVFFDCGKIGHYRYTYLSRKNAKQRNLIHVKQIWVRKEDFCMSKGMGPKWIWVPKN